MCVCIYTYVYVYVCVQDVLYVMPLVVTTLIIIGIAILVICIMYRAKRGYFCCLRPVSNGVHVTSMWF